MRRNDAEQCFDYNCAIPRINTTNLLLLWITTSTASMFNGWRKKCSVSCWDDKPVWGFDTMSWSFSKDASQKKLTADVLGKNFRLFFLLFSQAKVFREVYMAYWVFNISATHYLQLSSFDLETIPTKTWLIPHEAGFCLEFTRSLWVLNLLTKCGKFPCPAIVTLRRWDAPLS